MPDVISTVYRMLHKQTSIMQNDAPYFNQLFSIHVTTVKSVHASERAQSNKYTNYSRYPQSVEKTNTRITAN